MAPITLVSLKAFRSSSTHHPTFASTLCLMDEKLCFRSLDSAVPYIARPAVSRPSPSCLCNSSSLSLQISIPRDLLWALGSRVCSFGPALNAFTDHIGLMTAAPVMYLATKDSRWTQTVERYPEPGLDATAIHMALARQLECSLLFSLDV